MVTLGYLLEHSRSLLWAPDETNELYLGVFLNVCMLNAFNLHNLHTSIQAPKDWHLILIVLLITSVAVALVVGKTISQQNPPFLRRDNEDSEGRMVRPVRTFQIYLSKTRICIPIYTELSIASMVVTRKYLLMVCAFKTFPSIVRLFV